MTLARTIHRREARKRARAAAIRRQREWDALSPQERERRENWSKMLRETMGWFAKESLALYANDLKFVAGSQWPADTIRVRLPERFTVKPV